MPCMGHSYVSPLGHCLHALIYIVVPIKLLKIYTTSLSFDLYNTRVA